MIQQLPYVLLTSLTIALSGCGFALRGTTPTLQVAPAYQSTVITLDDNPVAFALKRPLATHLQTLGVVVSDTAPQQILVTDIHFRRYDIVGTLTEVQLVLSATVNYTLVKDGKATTVSTPMQVAHSYQYNEASVIPSDVQGEKVKVWLYDALAQRIAEQYRSESLR